MKLEPVVHVDDWVEVMYDDDVSIDDISVDEVSASLEAERTHSSRLSSRSKWPLSQWMRVLLLR